MDKDLSKMTYAELVAEWRRWDEEIRNITNWGEAVAIAHESRQACTKEFDRRRES